MKNVLSLFLVCFLFFFACNKIQNVSPDSDSDNTKARNGLIAQQGSSLLSLSNKNTVPFYPCAAPSNLQVTSFYNPNSVLQNIDIKFATVVGSSSYTVKVKNTLTNLYVYSTTVTCTTAVCSITTGNIIQYGVPYALEVNTNCTGGGTSATATLNFKLTGGPIVVVADDLDVAQPNANKDISSNSSLSFYTGATPSPNQLLCTGSFASSSSQHIMLTTPPGSGIVDIDLSNLGISVNDYIGFAEVTGMTCGAPEKPLPTGLWKVSKVTSGTLIIPFKQGSKVYRIRLFGSNLTVNNYTGPNIVTVGP